MKIQKFLSSQNNMEKKIKVRGFMLPSLKTYHKAVVIKTVCYWCKGRSMDKQNRISEIDSYIYIWPIGFNTIAKVI